MHALHHLLTLATLVSATIATPISSCYLALPTAATGNLTLAITNRTSKSLTTEAEVTPVSGWCTITGVRSYGRGDRGIELTLVDYAGTTLYIGRTAEIMETLCAPGRSSAWPTPW